MSTGSMGSGYNYSVRMDRRFRQGPQMIPQTDFTTPPLMHNNIGKTVDHQTVIENHLHIDSRDRDKSRAPDPFSFQ